MKEICLQRLQQAVAAAKSVAEGLQYVGVLCVEFFVLQDGSLVVNEIAPRPHNSGHYSQNACDVSQFELQVRTMAGLPLTQPRLHSPPSCSTCWATCGLRRAMPRRPPLGSKCWPCPAPTCTCTASATPSAAARWGT
jgi:formate-dependent phosphoribosylglycinamide formyltransferase (GAR transformylase)